MTELLSREKEFIKLNEHLDKLTTNALEQTQHPQQQQHGADVTAATTTTSTGQTKPTETRFLTYTKMRGPSTVLKKRGAGDAGPDVIIENIQMGKCTANDTANIGTIMREQRQMRNIKTAAATSTHPQSMTMRNDMDKTSTSAAESVRKDNHNAHTMRNSTTTAVHHRRQVKAPDSSTRTLSRTSHNRASISTPFTIKYRNPNFVQSPSLEMLLKDESASVRQNILPKTQASPRQSQLTDAESLAATDVGSVTRRLGAGVNKKQLSSEGLIKFLKSKIAILEDDHDRISQEMNEQKEMLEKTLDRHKKVELQRDQAYSKHNALTEQVTKMETQLEDTNRRLKERILEQTSQQKELEITKRELKLLTQTNVNLEKRLYRANEELENTKNALTLMRTSERELKETTRCENEGKEKQIKMLKKQRADLLNAYKKQLFLIDNLKRQNVCMEQSKMIGFEEKEFTKVLDWNTRN